MKALLAFLWFSIAVEHPFITLGIVVTIIYFVYKQHEEDKSDELSFLPDSIPPEVTDLINNRSKKFVELSSADRKKVVEFCDAVDMELAINGDKPAGEKMTDMIDAKIQARMKIDEFQTTTPLIDMTPEERESVFAEIKTLNGRQSSLNGREMMRYTLLLHQRLQYKARTLSPEDRDTYNKLFGKKASGGSFTEAEAAKYNELHQIVMNTPPIIDD